MHQYDPDNAPDPEAWLATPEEEQMALVLTYHEQCDPLPSDEANLAHATIHTIIENQLAMEIDAVVETLARLTRQGLRRHDALHAIGSVLGEEIWRLQTGRTDAHQPGVYRRKLQKLTAKRWRKR